MTTLEFLSHLRGLDLRLWVEGEQLRYSASSGALTPALRAELSRRKDEIFAFLREAQAAVSSTSPLRPASRDEDLPLSFAQQRLWFLNQLEPDSPAYNVPFAARLHGALNLPALEQALGEVARRHESLRTRFPSRGGRPAQLISPPSGFRAALVDLSHLPPAEAAGAARRLAEAEAGSPFDLARGPLWRGTLLRLGGAGCGLLITMHHIVSDGWSVGVLKREAAALYGRFGVGAPSPFEELGVQYADYAAWQRGRLRGEALEGQLAYWRERLADLRVLEPPADRARPAAGTSRAGVVSRLLPKDLTGSLKALSRREGCSLFMTLLAAFQAALGWAARQQDVAVGTDIAGRNRSETEGLIGFFVNQLVLRTDLSGDPSFRELLGRVREVVLGAYAHQELPFEKLVEELRPRREPGRTPLFDVKIVLHNAPSGAAGGFAGLKPSPLGVDKRATKCDWLLDLTETGRGLHAELEYNADLYDKARVAPFLERYEALLRRVTEDPGAKLSRLAEALDRTEKQQLVARHKAFKEAGRRKLQAVELKPEKAPE